VNVNVNVIINVSNTLSSLKFVFSSLCICIQIILKKINYVMLLKIALYLNLLWTSHYKVILRRKG